MDNTRSKIMRGKDKPGRSSSCARCYIIYEEFFETCFERLGVFINEHPTKVIFVCVFVNCALMAGLVSLKSENDVEVLYTPQNSQSFQDRSFLKNHYRDPTIENFMPYQLPDLGTYADIIIMSKNNTNIKSNIYFKELREIDKFIRQSVFVSEGDGSLIFFEDLCIVQFGHCSVFGEVVLSPRFEIDFILGNVTYPRYHESLLSSILAIPKEEGGLLVSTKGVKLRYYLSPNSPLSEKWESEFHAKIQGLSTNQTDISYSTSKSLGTELEKNTNGDIQFFSLTFTIMLTYASFASASSFLTCNSIGNRLMLGLAGVLAPVLAIGSAIGFLSAVGVKFTSIVGVMPFLIVGIGIDDMFILMSGMAEAPALTTATIKDRMKFMMKKSGVAITITSITDLLAFTIGATSVFVSIRTFCIYAGVAVFFCYLNQLFFFSPAMYINEKRTQQKRHFLCCMKITEKEDSSKSCVRRYFCSGFIPKKREELESDLEKYPKQFIIRLVLKHTVGKIFIFVLFMTYLGFAIFGTIHLEQGLSLYNLVSEESHFHEFSLLDEQFFKTEPVIMLSINGEYNYSLQNIQTMIKAILTEAKSDKDIDEKFEINWLESYKQSAYYDIRSSNNFFYGLKNYIKDCPQFSNDIVFNDDFSSILFARFYIKSKDLKSSKAQGLLMSRLRIISSTAGISCIFYTPAFIFYEQYVEIWPSTFQTVGTALGVMIVVTIIFMPNPLMVFVVFMTLMSILVGIFGFMYFWGLTLSSITMIHLVMSVGFSVDFSVHICHAFLAVRSEKQATVLKGVLNMVGGPIINAAFSSLLGISMLGFSKSYIFQSFGKVMFLVIGFGLFHAIFVLPVILWILFPCYSTKQSKKVEQNTLSLQDTIQEFLQTSNMTYDVRRCRLDLLQISKSSTENEIIYNLPVFVSEGNYTMYCYKKIKFIKNKNDTSWTLNFVDQLLK